MKIKSLYLLLFLFFLKMQFASSKLFKRSLPFLIAGPTYEFIYNTLKKKSINNIPNKHIASLHNSFKKHVLLSTNNIPIDDNRLMHSQTELEVKNFERFNAIFHELGHLLENLLYKDLSYYIQDKKIDIKSPQYTGNALTTNHTNIFLTKNPKITFKIAVAGYLSNLLLNKAIKKNKLYDFHEIAIEIDLNESSDFLEALNIINYFNLSPEFIDETIKETVSDLNTFMSLQILYSYYIYNNKPGSAYGEQFSHLSTITIHKNDNSYETITHNISAHKFNPFSNIKDLESLKNICTLIVNSEKNQQIKALVLHALKNIELIKPKIIENNNTIYAKKFNLIKEAVKIHGNKINNVFNFLRS